MSRIRERAGIMIFRLTVRKDLVEEPYCALFHKSSGSEKVYE